MGRIAYQYEPLQNRPTGYKSRKPSPFKADFTNTQNLLNTELEFLKAKNVAIQVDVERSDIRLDGGLYAGTKLRSPAIALSFDSKHGPLTYPCDTYSDWKANLRAIALALQALRAVDRYGVTAKGEQYTGWAKLPAPSSNGFATRGEATNFLRTIIGSRVDQLAIDAALRECEFATHPDRGGNPEDFKKVQAARKVLIG